MEYGKDFIISSIKPRTCICGKHLSTNGSKMCRKCASYKLHNKEYNPNTGRYE